MSKRNRKRLLSVLLTTALIFTLALSSVMAQDEEHVRADKLSVGTEAVEDEETTDGFIEEDVGEIIEDEVTEETVSVDKINGAGSSADDAAEEADADAAEVAEEEPEDGIQTLSAEDTEDEENDIMPLALTGSGTKDSPYEVSTADELTSAIGKYTEGSHTWYIKLTDDISGSRYTVGGTSTGSSASSNGHYITVYIDLNGHTITGSSSSSYAVAFFCHSSLVLSNGTIQGDGGESSYPLIRICGNCLDTADGYAVILDNVTLKDNPSTGATGGITVQSGQNVKIQNGSVITNCSGTNGSAVYNAGTVDMVDSTITDCSSSGNGGAVSNSGTFNMTGGTITGCSAAENGGGVYNSGSFNLYGGSITGNSGSGIYVENDSTLTVFSGASVLNNATSNVCLEDGALITLGEELSGKAQIGVTTATDPTQGSPVAFTVAEGDSTSYYATSATYFTSDKGYAIHVNYDATKDYLEQYIPSEFEQKYLIDPDDTYTPLYTETTSDNAAQILSGIDDWNALSEDEQAEINADLTAANSGEELTYPMLLARAFEQTYLSDEDGNLYTQATVDNYEQILSGAEDWDRMTQEERDLVNSALTEANGGVPLTYDDLLEQARAIETANEFIYNYVSDNDVDNPYLEATVDNYQRILSGEDTWNAMSQLEQDAVNAILTTAWQAAGHDGELTYPMLLEQAKALETANEFIYNYVSDNDVDNPYLEATVDNYQRILSGEDTWNAMSQLEQDAVNAILTAAWQAAGNEGELTYPMLLEWAKALAAELEETGAVKTGDSSRLYLYLLLIAAAGAAASAAVAVSKRRV